MQVPVRYYSRGGNTHRPAEAVAEVQSICHHSGRRPKPLQLMVNSFSENPITSKSRKRP
jgi:hypothetical protein